MPLKGGGEGPDTRTSSDTPPPIRRHHRTAHSTSRPQLLFPLPGSIPAVSQAPVTSLSRACKHPHPPGHTHRLSGQPAAPSAWEPGLWRPTHNSRLPSRPHKPLPRHNHSKHQLFSPRSPGPLSPCHLHPQQRLQSHFKASAEAPVLSAPPSSHPHPKPSLPHSLCCHGKGVLEAILLLGGGGGGGCCCCCCHGGRGPEGGGGGCPLGGGGGGGIMPIGGGGIMPAGGGSAVRSGTPHLLKTQVMPMSPWQASLPFP